MPLLFPPGSEMGLSVGLIRTRYLGDVVLLVPLIREIRAFDPESRITVVVNAGTAYPLERIPGVEVLPLATEGKLRRLVGTLSLAGTVRSRKLDLLLDLTLSDRSRLITRLSGAARTGAAGDPADRRSGDSWDTFFPVDLNNGPDHMILQFGRLLAETGIPVSGIRDKSFPPDPRWSDPADALLRKHFPDGNPVLFLHPGGRHWFKRWPPDRFARLADLWVAKRGGGVLVAGTKAERTLVESVLSGTAEEGIVPLIGAPVGLLDALVRRATVFVGADSGPLHIADAAHVPLVGLFGSTLPEVWGPAAGPRREVVRHPVPCSPCPHVGCTMGEENCLSRITVREVFDRVESVLQ